MVLYNNSEDARFFHEFTGTINHNWLTNQSACIDVVIIYVIANDEIVFGNHLGKTTGFQSLVKLPKRMSSSRFVALQPYVLFSWISFSEIFQKFHSTSQSTREELEVGVSLAVFLFCADVSFLCIKTGQIDIPKYKHEGKESSELIL